MIYDDIINDQMSGLANMVNLGRDRTAISKCKKAEYYAILDKKTCPLCRELDGSVVEVGSSEHQNHMPPIHNRCRCIWVYYDEQETNQPNYQWNDIDENLILQHGYLVGKNYISTEDETLGNIIKEIIESTQKEKE
jgi:SPP1 gp7 family putative phage head morphogenesis protein